MPEHVEVPLTLQVGLQVSPAFPLFIDHHATGMIEVSSPEVMNAALLGIRTLNEFLAFYQRLIANFRYVELDILLYFAFLSFVYMIK